MHAVISSLIAASLLLHAVLGCCRHHAHDQAGPAVGVARAGGCCHEHEDAGDHHAPATPCPGKSECQGVCTYLPPQKTQFEIPLLPTTLAGVYLPGLPADLAQSLSPAWLDAVFCTGAAPPHVRLHLALSVLLV